MTATDTSAPHFDFGRVVSRTFSLIGRNFVPFAILSAIFVGVPSVIVLLVQPTLIASAPDLVSVVALVSGLIGGLLGLVLQAALTRASIDDLSGKGTSLNAALGTGVAVLLPMIGLGIIVSLAVLLGLLLLIVPGVYLALRWAVAAPVLVVEKLGVFASMERSAALTQNHRWAILGLVVLYVVFLFILYVIIGLAVPGAALAVSGLTPTLPSLLVLITMTVLQILTSLVATVGGAAIYFELRQIKEGVGVHELAQVFA